MRPPAPFLVAIVSLLAACMPPPVSVVLEISGQAPPEGTVAARARWRIPGVGSGIFPSKNSVIDEHVAVVAEGAGRWAVRDLPRRRSRSYELESVHLAWGGAEPSGIDVYISEADWADTSRAVERLTASGESLVIDGFGGFNLREAIRMRPETVPRELDLHLASHRALPAPDSSFVLTEPGKIGLYLTRERCTNCLESASQTPWDLRSEPLDLQVYAVSEGAWASTSLPCSPQPGMSHGCYARSPELGWLGEHGMRAETFLNPEMGGDRPPELGLAWPSPPPPDARLVVVATHPGDALAWLGELIPKASVAASTGRWQCCQHSEPGKDASGQPCAAVAWSWILAEESCSFAGDAEEVAPAVCRAWELAGRPLVCTEH